MNTESDIFFSSGEKASSGFFMYSGYRYGFNGMEKDDEVKNIVGSSYDFGARMYDPRVGRFLSLDPKAKEFSHFSPYCYAGNSPILFIDENGEGPSPGEMARRFINSLFAYKLAGAKGIGGVWTESLETQISGGIPGMGAGAIAHYTLAADPHGNVALVMGSKLFYDIFQSETGLGDGGAAEEGNFSLGGTGSVTYSVNTHWGKDNVLELGGNKSANAAIDHPMKIKGGEGFAGSVEVGEDNFGLGIGIGIGIGIAKIGTDNTVLATNEKDLTKYFEATQNAIESAKTEGGSIMMDYNASVNGDVVTIDYTFKVVKETNGTIEVIDSFDAGSISINQKEGQIYTESVNSNDE